MPKYTAERIEQIRGHLSELDRRRVPVTEFAREIGVAAWTVHTWKRRFGSGPSGAAKSAKGGTADLVEVERPRPGAAIEIVVDTVTVRVPSRFDVDDLERVLRVVRSC